MKQPLQNFEVEIVEEIVEIRTLTVRARTPQGAHVRAYESWVERGKPKQCSVSVNERKFHIKAPDGTAYVGNDDYFEDELAK